MAHTARGEFVVSLKPLAFEGADPEFKSTGTIPKSSTLGRMSIDKQMSGDLAASTVGQMLTAVTSINGSAGYVAVERVTGVLNGKRGTFVLQHTGERLADQRFVVDDEKTCLLQARTSVGVSAVFGSMSAAGIGISTIKRAPEGWLSSTRMVAS